MATLIYEYRDEKREIVQRNVFFTFEDNMLLLFNDVSEMTDEDYYEDSFDGVITYMNLEYLEFLPFAHAVSPDEDITSIILVFDKKNEKKYLEGK